MSKTDFVQTSYLTPLGDPRVRQWMKLWADQRSIEICGLTQGAKACGQPAGSGSPPADAITVSQNAPALQNVVTQIFAMAMAGETASEAYGRVCGSAVAEAAVAAPLINQYSDISSVPTPGAGSSVTLPPCPGTAQARSAPRTALARKGDSAWTFWQQDRANGLYDLPWDQYATEFGKLNGISPDLLQTGSIKIPAQTVSAPAATAVAATLTAGAEPILSLSSAEADCKASSDPNYYPFDIDQVLQVLRLNRRNGTSRTSATVLIADSGIELAGAGIFPERVFADKLDMPFNEFAEAKLPHVTSIRARRHGTQVASVALGGPSFAYTQADVDEPRLRLIISPIYFESEGGVRFDTNNVSRDIVNLAGRYSGTVVNLSLRSTVRIEAILTDLKYGSATLYVAATGNQKTQIGMPGTSLTEIVSYPALYGGNGRSRLISVAALNGVGDLAEFSNWSPEYVDIAAPGCGVPALSANDDNTHLERSAQSGTSIAAPLVTFTAAMIRSETGLSGEELKRRIMASADVDPGDLALHVIDGRRLNIPKALAVAEDVLEMSGGTTQFGSVYIQQGGKNLKSNESIALHCNSKPLLTLTVGSVRKIARFGGSDDNPPFLVYYLAEDSSPDSVLSRDICQAPTSWSMQFKEADATAPIDVTFAKLKDYVPHRYQ